MPQMLTTPSAACGCDAHTRHPPAPPPNGEGDDELQHNVLLTRPTPLSAPAPPGHCPR
jgi:hypothetical protein